MTLYINGNECLTDWDYTDGFSLDIPLSGSTLDVEVKIGDRGVPGRTYFQHTFAIEPGATYEAELSGNAASFSGFKVKLSRPNEVIEGNTPACRRNMPVAILAFCFPIYGIILAITSCYNRIASIGGAASGFLLGVIGSSLIPSGYEAGIGFGRVPLISYEPFSFLDFFFNILIGGIATINGLLRALLENLLG